MSRSHKAEQATVTEAVAVESVTAPNGLAAPEQIAVAPVTEQPIVPNMAEAEAKPTARSVERLMGNKAESRFEFIQEKAEFASEELLDV